MTAAHRSLPFGTCLVIGNPRTGRKVAVRVNNRGPFSDMDRGGELARRIRFRLRTQVKADGVTQRLPVSQAGGLLRVIPARESGSRDVCFWHLADLYAGGKHVRF